MSREFDLSFLKELKQNVLGCKSDIVKFEMAITMIDDWIDELSAQEPSAASDGESGARSDCVVKITLHCEINIY